uniref:Uncharacterized protein n=1 Tax=Clytia hemisphaerica TaxID=252671 RepID=A0A7M5VAG2_9CNID
MTCKQRLLIGIFMLMFMCVFEKFIGCYGVSPPSKDINIQVLCTVNQPIKNNQILVKLLNSDAFNLRSNTSKLNTITKNNPLVKKPEIRRIKLHNRTINVSYFYYVAQH